jgi:TetR/AcrR family transcriptional regulator, cholesterol catabolism regulator
MTSPAGDHSLPTTARPRPVQPGPVPPGQVQPSPVPPSPVQPRSAQRRELLVTTAIRHMLEHGFEGFSVNTLAEDVGMSVGGMYRYIRTKSDLLVMACEDIYGGALREQLAEVTTGENPLPGKLHAAIELYLRSCLALQDQILLTYREYRNLPRDAQRRYMDREKGIAGVFMDIIAAGVRRGIFRPGISPALLAEDIIVLGHLPALKAWALRNEVTAEDLVRQHCELIMSRLLPAPVQRPGDF